MAKKHLPSQKKDTKSSKISEKATANVSQVGTTDHLKPSFRFTYADDKRWHLSEWKADEIKDLIREWKKDLNSCKGGVFPPLRMDNANSPLLTPNSF